jgi:hypothetical protein
MDLSRSVSPARKVPGAAATRASVNLQQTQAPNIRSRRARLEPAFIGGFGFIFLVSVDRSFHGW